MSKLLFLLTALVTATTVTAADGPVELTAENFDAAILGKNAMVKFLAPWYVCRNTGLLVPRRSFLMY